MTWMSCWRRLLLGLMVLTLGCHAPLDATREPPTGGVSPPPAQKRITAVTMGEPTHFEGRFNPSIGSTPGLDTIEEMLNAGTANFEADGELRPQLAEAVPSVENGLWKLLPDGRMETTWKI